MPKKIVTKEIIKEIINLVNPKEMYNVFTIRKSELKPYEKIIMHYVNFKKNRKNTIKSKKMSGILYFKGQDVINFFMLFNQYKPRFISLKEYNAIKYSKYIKTKDDVIDYLDRNCQ